MGSQGSSTNSSANITVQGDGNIDAMADLKGARNETDVKPDTNVKVGHRMGTGDKPKGIKKGSSGKS